MHRVLRNQLKRAARLATPDDLQTALGELKALAEAGSLGVQATALAGNLAAVFDRVSTTYDQADRDMELRNRSLLLSSEELQVANTRLHEEAESQNQSIQALRETAEGLLDSMQGSCDDGIMLDVGDNDSVAALTNSILRLIDQRATALKALEQQKFAIDQHAIVSITDTTGVITYANDLFCKISGYTRDELIGRSHRIVNSRLHSPDVFKDMWQTIGHGGVWHGDLCNRAKDGSLYWVSATIVPMMGDDGMPESYIAIRTDITHQKRMEEELLSSRTFLQSITDSMGEGVFCLDSRGCCTFMNPEAERLLGWTLPEIKDQVMHDIIHYKTPDGTAIAAADCPTLAHIARGETYHTEDEHYIHRDGTIFPIAITVVPMWDDGHIHGSVAVFQDITSRKQIQQALAESEDRLKVALEAANIGLWDWNPQTDKAYFSDEWLRMLGYHSADFEAGQNIWLDLLHPEDRQKAFSALEEHISGETSRYEVEFRMHHKYGHWVWVLASGKVMARDGSGDPIRITGIHMDVTDRKSVEAELARAKDEADRANQFKSAFLANMSHEIRTPMNAVIGLSHLALQTDLSTRQRDYLEKIHNASKNLLGILNDILDFSKIEAGRMELEKIPFRLSDVLDNLVTVALPKVREKSLSLDIDQAPDVPDGLLGDPLRLGQVLINLVGNAVKFTERGQVVISISAETITPSTDEDALMRLTFRIRDSGIGMTEEQSKGLFKAFTQADSSTTRRFGGTGLGLAISRQFVELMGGQISVNSSPGRGSTFTFTIQAHATPHAGYDGAVPADIKGMNVLVVDDNPTARVILSNTLRQYGFAVDVVVNGEDAIAAVDRKRGGGYGLLVVDWRLPDIDGAEVCRRLRDMGHEKLPVLAITAYGAEQAQESFASIGPVELLEKPITSTRLMDAVLSTLGRRPRSGDGSQNTRDIDAIQGLLGAEVLLVEDNPINQQVARELLEGVGIAVTVCGGGQHGVDALRSNTFDLVLMDIQMPDMDGYQATALIRNELHLVDLPVIAMTAHTMAGDRERCLDAGMNDHVGKPIDPDALFTVLVRWIKPRHRRPEAKAGELPRPNREETSLPDHLEGFDLKAALHSVNGNAHLLRRLLVDFATGHGAEALVLRPAVAEGRINDAIRIAHTLKGTAATIGAMDVSRTAAVLEKRLMAGDTDVGAEIDALALALGQIIRSVASMDPLPNKVKKISAATEAQAAKPVALDPKEIAALLARVEDDLNNADPSAEESVETLLVALADTPYVSQAEAILRAARDFDFDDGLTALSALKENLSAELSAISEVV